ncbi:O-antigen ligase family protein [Ectopseudomonas khazarica]|uniref:O-antigen ligase family protein n=1 Tax=Ectopseudomonas khazarica TaxID=2502979 RepID=UPI0006902A89|nr:O-antigen ligase family protein [Pseudomonas khazarica]QTS87129.1 O-antigen ligase family protein [Pseudomonas khazarica]
MSSAIRTWPRSTSDFISTWLLPLGYFCLLTSLAWLEDRSLYHKLFYALMAAPALLVLILQPRRCAPLFRDPTLLAYLVFAAWALLSITWSSSEDAAGSLAKRPLYVAMLFTACTLMVEQNYSRFIQVIRAASLLIIAFAAYGLVDFVLGYSSGARLTGTDALQNPLLSSHLFGFFCIIWLGWVMTAPAKQSLLALSPLALLLATLLATGSRTPILATALAAIWLILCCWNARSALLAGIVPACLAALLLLFPESLLNRGTSYRPEIWQLALDKIVLQPWLGYGFDAPLSISVPGLGYSFSEPHNLFLGVLYYTGVIGAALWLLMHALALWTCWRHRQDTDFIIVGALVVYGIGAGLAEGGGILARPKEHWFLTWIPLAMVTALNIGRKLREKA